MTPKFVRLSEISLIESGGTPSSDNPAYWNGDINWVTLVDVKNKYVTSTKRKITVEGLKNSSAKLLPVGTVLFSSRATIGEVSIANVELATNQGFKNFICDLNKIIPEYLYFVLKFEARKIANSVSSTTFKEISKTKLSEYKIPLCSLEEQNIIVKKLNLIESLRQKRKTATHLLDSYLISVFYEMFGDPNINPKKYSQVTIKDIADKVTDGEHITPKRISEGIKLLSARNVKNGYLDFDAGVDYIGNDEYQRISKRCNPEFGDVLISCSGTIGRVTTVDVVEPFTLVRSAALIKPNKTLINSKYLEYFLRTPYSQRLMNKSVNQSSQANLFLGQINKLPVLLPPISDQLAFVKIFNSVSLTRQKMLRQSHEIENQFQALVQKEFNGGKI